MLKSQKNSQPEKDNDKQLQELGRRFQSLMEIGYVSKKQALWFSFLKGIAAGAGAFVGGTVVISIVVWILSYFSGVPVIDKLQSLLTSANFLF